MTSPVQESFENFENLKFDPWKLMDVLLGDSNDPDKNFYNSIQAIGTQYYFPSDVLSLSGKLHINSENISALATSFNNCHSLPSDLFVQRGKRLQSLEGTTLGAQQQWPFML